MEGFQAAALEPVVNEIDIFVTTAGNFKIIRLKHMQKMRAEPQLLYKSKRCTLVSFV